MGAHKMTAKQLETGWRLFKHAGIGLALVINICCCRL